MKLTLKPWHKVSCFVTNSYAASVSPETRFYIYADGEEPGKTSKPVEVRFWPATGVAVIQGPDTHGMPLAYIPIQDQPLILDQLLTAANTNHKQEIEWAGFEP